MFTDVAFHRLLWIVLLCYFLSVMVLHWNSLMEPVIVQWTQCELVISKMSMVSWPKPTPSKYHSGCLDLIWLEVCYILISLFSSYIRTLLHNYAVLHNKKNNQHKRFSERKLAHKKTLIKLGKPHAYHSSPNEYIYVSAHRQCVLSVLREANSYGFGL